MMVNENWQNKLAVADEKHLEKLNYQVSIV